MNTNTESTATITPLPGKKLGGISGAGFRPGVSGNPAGRCPGSVSLATRLRQQMTKRNARAIARKLIELAEKGEMSAIKMVFNVHDGADIETRLEKLEEKLLEQGN